MRNMATILCVAGAIYLMAKGQEGWGWLLFVAIMLGVF